MSFILAEPDGTDIPRTIERDQAAGSAYTQGALLLVDGSGNFAECGADPAAIAAVAASGAGADASGFNILAKKGFPPGKMQGYTLKGKTFSAKYVGTLPGADGGTCGVVKDTDGDWKIDFAEATVKPFKLVGRRTNSPENIPRVLVRAVDSFVQDI